MFHLISDIIEHKFHSYIIPEPEEYIGSGAKSKKLAKKIKVWSSGKFNNFGPVLKKLNEFLPKIYQNVDKESLADISNSNRLESIGWYIDMDQLFILKENLPDLTKYAITEKDSQTQASVGLDNQIYISKPSHLFVGSGKHIMIGPKDVITKRRNVKFDGENLKWIVQPLLTDIILWHDRYKFDIRLFGIVYNVGDRFHAAVSRYGVCRRSVNIHDPLNDPNSAITNISIQETIPGYDAEFHMPLVYDDQEIGINILRDLIKDQLKLKRDLSKRINFLILGLDIIFLSNGEPKIIEVNAGPHLEIRDEPKYENNEKIASEAFINGCFGYILPAALEGRYSHGIKDWDFC